MVIVPWILYRIQAFEKHSLSLKPQSYTTYRTSVGGDDVDDNRGLIPK